jgi:hypothetical protein
MASSLTVVVKCCKLDTRPNHLFFVCFIKIRSPCTTTTTMSKTLGMGTHTMIGFFNNGKGGYKFLSPLDAAASSCLFACCTQPNCCFVTNLDYMDFDLLHQWKEKQKTKQHIGFTNQRIASSFCWGEYLQVQWVFGYRESAAEGDWWWPAKFVG